METEDQTAVITFLASPSTHDGAAVERIDTHASIVFLAGARAWKLKRAVRYDYLDFATLDRRRAMCEAEVRINRRTAPGVYRGVTPVTREGNGALALGGSGTPVEWLVEMTRFDLAGLFDRLATSGALDLMLMRPLAAEIARFHSHAELRQDHGGRAGMEWVIDGNAVGFAEQGAGILDPVACAQLTLGAQQRLDRDAGVLDARREMGFVRQCHGDLHLRNIVLIDGRPTLFDGIEFNDAISCIDVMYDLAFLIMDLWRRELPRHANAILNGYLADAGDFGGLSALPLFLSCRAAVRAKTSATAATLQADASRRRELQVLAREYLRMADQMLRHRDAGLIAIGGLSGTGKSTLALALAPSVGPVPGAIVLRSDEVRKHLCGVAPTMRLGPEGYVPGVSQRVYGTLAERAALVLERGHSAIVDAVFARPEDRDAVERVALDADVPFVGVWLDAPEAVLAGRVRRRGPDASDADTAVVRAQAAQGIGRVSWQIVDGTRPTDSVRQQVSSVLGQRLRTWQT
jgi:aminoglycoside phosphotransferase family enzyme/predicted kinase